jgi:hypothetical protein
MHRNGLWLIFLSLFLLISAWFAVKAGRQLAGYVRHSEAVMAKIDSWGVAREGGSKFFITAKYTYRFKGVDYEGAGELSDRSYRNPWAAEAAIPHLAEKEWSVWIDPKRPGRSLLVRALPLKDIVYALVLVGLLIYFSWIGYQVGQQSAGQADAHL